MVDTARRPPDRPTAMASGQDSGLSATHDVDRALRELLEEERIAQMGGQILLGFLFAVAYTPVMAEADAQERGLYAWALGVTMAAVVLLLSTVPLHRLNFGRRLRSPVLVVGHALSLGGIAALGVGLVLSIRLAARFALPDVEGLLTGIASVLIIGCWLGAPLGVRLSSKASETEPSRRREDD